MLPTRDPLDREHAVPHALRATYRASTVSGIGCISDTDPQRCWCAAFKHAWARSRHHHGGPSTTPRLVEKNFASGGRQFMARLGQVNTTGSSPRSSTRKTTSFRASSITGIHRRVAHAAHHHPGRPDHRRARQGYLPVLIGKSDDGFCISFRSFATTAGLPRRVRPGRRDRAGEPRRVPSPRRRQDEDLRVLWVYYGYPNSNYEGVNVEGHALSQRRHHGARRTRRARPSSTSRGRRARLGRAAQSLRHRMPKPLRPPFIKYARGRARSCRATRKCNRVAKMKQIHIPELINGKAAVRGRFIVRGTWAERTVDFLYKCGAEVHMRSACPPIMFSCKYLGFSSSRSTCTRAAWWTAEAGVQHLDEYADGSTERGKCMLKSICEQMGFDSLGYPVARRHAGSHGIGIGVEGVHVLLDRRNNPEGRLPSAALLVLLAAAARGKRSCSRPS